MIPTAVRYPSAWLEELRARSEIVETISAYVPLKKNGSKHWGLCPFHGEKTASFSVDQKQQLFYCFGCKAGGSVIQFIMEMERLSFPEAVKFLADRAQMRMPDLVEDDDYQRKKSLREKLWAINTEAARFYHETLYSPRGQKALAYLKNRGLTDSVIRKFGLGAAPDDWDALTRYLVAKGYAEDDLALCGLTVIKDADETKPRRVFDMFRARAIFPIIDQFNHVLGFGGRALEKIEPKYLNTADTPIFNKRYGVYAANLLKKQRHLDRVVLVEGYMDVVSLSQFGVEGVCATLGTALTPDQARLLKRFAPKVYLGYDGDSAGQHAILRGLEILENEDIPARVLDFPDGLDPDEFIRRDGPEGFAALPAISPTTYRMRRLKEQFDVSTQDGRIEYARACAALLQKLDPVETETHLQELMVQTGFPRETLISQIGIRVAPAAPSVRPQPQRSVPKAAKSSEIITAEETLISLMAGGQLPRDLLDGETFDDPLLETVYHRLLAGDSPALLMEQEEDNEARARLSRLLMAPPAADTDALIRMAQQCLNTIRRCRIDAELDALEKQLPSLQGKEQLEALMRCSELQKRRQQLKNEK